MNSTPSDPRHATGSAEETARLIAAIQSELVGVKADMAVRVASLEETIANLANENTLLKRRLFGNKTERSHTSEAQLTLGDLLADEARLQKELDAAVAKAKEQAGVEPEQPGAPGERPKPKGRRDLFASNLPRCLLEILDEELEAKGCRRIGFEESKQLMFRRGGFSVLVKRVARYEVIQGGSPTVVTVPSPETLFPRALLHTSTVAHLMTAKFGLGVPHYRLERDLADQGVALDRGTMGRSVEHAGNTLGATIVEAMWTDAIANAHVISTDATGALVQPAKAKADGRAQACKKGHLFTAVVDCDAILFAYVEPHTSESVKKLFGGFGGYLQADASNVYDVLRSRAADGHRRGRDARGLLRAPATLFLRGCDLPLSGWLAGPDADSRHLRRRSSGKPCASDRAPGAPRTACATIGDQLLRLGAGCARGHAGPQPRDQGARVRTQPRDRVAARARRRQLAARQHAFRAGATQDCRRSQSLDVLR